MRTIKMEDPTRMREEIGCIYKKRQWWATYIIIDKKEGAFRVESRNANGNIRYYWKTLKELQKMIKKMIPTEKGWEYLRIDNLKDIIVSITTFGKNRWRESYRGDLEGVYSFITEIIKKYGKGGYTFRVSIKRNTGTTIHTVSNMPLTHIFSILERELSESDAP